jgi:uncharacterized protein YdeI (BOF family)
MSRKLVVFTAVVLALSSLAVASTIARSGVVQPYQTKADFDQAFAAVGATSTVMTAKAAVDVEKLRQAGLKRINLAQSAR